MLDALSVRWTRESLETGGMLTGTSDLSQRFTVLHADCGGVPRRDAISALRLLRKPA
jgi:hypothetical protein